MLNLTSSVGRANASLNFYQYSGGLCPHAMGMGQLWRLAGCSAWGALKTQSC